MKLNPNATYSRVGSVLLENGVEILKFTQEFPVNIEKLGAKAISYHEKYISANPGLVEWLIEEEEQLEYFREEIQAGKKGEVFMIERVDPTLDPAQVIDQDRIKKKGDVIIEVSALPLQKDLDQVIEAADKLTEELGPDPTLSRKEQVRFWMNKGVTSPSQIAAKLGANPSYVQRLKKEIENEKVD